MVVGARRGLTISEATDLLECSGATVSSAIYKYTENGVEKQRTSSEQKFCGQKMLS